MWLPVSAARRPFRGASTMSGVITPIKPVFPKPAEPDPRLARLAEKIEQIRHTRALRFRRQTVRRDDLH
jgi:hypothetical protein